MTTENYKKVHKIKMVLHPNAETPEEFITFSEEYISIYRNQFNLLSSNLKFLDFLELCTQPKTDEEKDSILLDFKNKLKRASEKYNCCMFDVLCLYSLHNIYESNSTSLSAVSRSLFAWYKLDDLVSHKHENRNLMIDPDNDCFLVELRQFTDIYSNSEGCKVLAFAGYESFMGANSSLARFLLKFGLIGFECNENSIQILSMVLKKFKENTDVVISPELEELAYLMKRSKFSFRRSVLTFFTIVLVAEYRMFEWASTEFGDETYEQMKCKSIPKLKCLNLLISATSETEITLRDIEYFIENILDPFRDPEVFLDDLVKTLRKMSCKPNAYYSPRSLKDLARCQIRECLQSSFMLPEQVKKLAIPDPLKEFLLFHCEEMWDLLEQSHLHVKIYDI